jgi:hypothetical protein
MEFLPMRINLDGGMCLLARLTDLRTFHTGLLDLDIVIDWWDMDCMTVASNIRESTKRKEKRRKVVAGWSWTLHVERRREKRRIMLRYEDGGTVAGRLDEELWNKL